MKQTLFILLVLYAGQIFGQHSDTVLLQNNRVVLMALDDNQIMNEGDSLFDRNMIKEAIKNIQRQLRLFLSNTTWKK